MLQRLHQIHLPRTPLLNRGLFLLLLVLLALLLRGYQLDAQSLWLDESSTWLMLQAPWSVLLADLVEPSSGYPLYHLLLKGWVLLFGDSETALRLPSALAGAAAVGFFYLLALELHPRRTEQPALFALGASLLLVFAPFALWYAQDAKVYSLLLLNTVLLIWSLLRALRLPSRTAWALFAAIAVVSLFVHRLAILTVIAAWVAYLLTAGSSRSPGWFGWAGWRWLSWLLVLLVSGFVVSEMIAGLGSGIAETGAYIPADPLTALWLTFLRFSFDRGPGEFPLVWLVPWLLLIGWGGALALHDALRGPPATGRTARLLLCFGLVPLLLFSLQLIYTRLYETRYLMIVYPAWLLLLAYPLTRLTHLRWRLLSSGLIGAALLTSGAALVQVPYGLFSGYPIKEQYRVAITTLAEQVHPDDAVILHPAYLQPVYRYYMQRATSDPPPEPITFEAFKHLQTEFNARDWDEARRQQLAGYLRSFLLIAPNHAYTVDRPASGADEYGLVGLYFRYSREQQKWPCGIWRYNGVHLFCQDSPEIYITGETAYPTSQLTARFGDHLQLQGYTLKATTTAGPGTYRAGGTLPITLFWEVTQPLAEDYAMFLHLCQDCALPPVASTDGPPLQGYLPTTTWTLGNPVHDERTIVLPADLPPGTYQLLVGIYPTTNPAEDARLPINTIDLAAQADPNEAIDAPAERLLPGNRLLLTTVDIVAPTNGTDTSEAVNITNAMEQQ